MDLENFKKYASEIALAVLALGKSRIDSLREIGDLSGAEILERDFIPKYEKLYSGLESEDFKKAFEEDSSSLEKLFNDIMEKNGFTKEGILEKIEKRKTLGENNGARSVKQLFQHELSEIKRRKNRYIEEADEVLKEEFIINTELSNSIQQEEQEEIIYKLHPLREKFRMLDGKLIELEKREQELEERIQKKWNYEIYGTLSQEELKKVFGEQYGKVDDEKND
ncbi:MAG: hypothetical protein ACRCTS_06780 [Fusobacteriaceae bacterium]